MKTKKKLFAVLPAVTLCLIHFFSILLTGTITIAKAEQDTSVNQTVSIHVYFNFYDSSSNDINRTIGLSSMEVTGIVKENCIEAQINQHPDIFDYEKVTGFPQVLLNYGDVSGREINITQECHYDPQSGNIQIPVSYKNEYLTVKCILSEQSPEYQLLIPDEYKVIKTADSSTELTENLTPGISNPNMARTPASDTSEFEVLTGSSNDISKTGDTNTFKAGDVIPVTNGYIQTLNRREDENLYNLTGTSAYMGYKGEAIGYAISFDCSSASFLSNIGNPGISGSGTFPTPNGTVSLDYSSRNWIYARCITTDSNYFDGNPQFTDGKIYVTNVADDGTLTCWIELYLSGPNGENAQDVGMYFKIHPLALRRASLTINKTIHTEDVYLAHGEPTFLFKIHGNDTQGNPHTWHRCMTFSQNYVDNNTNSSGTVTRSVTLTDLPRGLYYINEIPVSRYTLTNVTAQTDNVSVGIIPKLTKYDGITPIKAVVLANLEEKDGEVTFFNRKITWDKYSHNNMVSNIFSLETNY